MELKQLKAEVKKQMYLRGWKREELAKAIGFSVGSIDAFLYGTRDSGKVVDAILAVLGIER